eukprot:9467553-Pyramimonas_sp.AAC.2
MASCGVGVKYALALTNTSPAVMLSWCHSCDKYQDQGSIGYLMGSGYTEVPFGLVVKPGLGASNHANVASANLLQQHASQNGADFSPLLARGMEDQAAGTPTMPLFLDNTAPTCRLIGFTPVVTSPAD